MPRLDRFISAHTGTPRKHVRLMLAQGRITVNGHAATEATQVIDQFTRVVLDGAALPANTPRYLMLHKPPGVVFATKDPQHITVIDLLDQPWKNQLHIAGRLDFDSTGLVILTNDGRWSRRLSLPDSKLVKRYRVTTERAITPEQIEAFERGLYFGYEDIITRPARLLLHGERCAELALTEGRYHQIKRMFGRFDNKVLSIHRFAVGPYELRGLASGQSQIIKAL